MRRVTPEDWDELAGRMAEPQFQEQIARYKRQENLELISAWAPREVRSLLKTDVFEEGFGQDLLLDALVAMYPMVVGMDISPVVVAAAQRRVSGARCVVSDASALPFTTRSFDLIVSISTLDHLSPELLPGALGELCRVLRPAGCLILTLDSRHNPLHVLSNHIRRRMGQIYAERCYTVNEVLAALAHQPVTVTEATAIYHVPFPVNFLAKKARRLVGAPADAWIRGVIGLCRALGKFPTRFFTGRYIALRIVKQTEDGDGGGWTAKPDGTSSRR
jgi:SAM-dependent methyltransferase